jgi:hypothetical protein
MMNQIADHFVTHAVLGSCPCVATGYETFILQYTFQQENATNFTSLVCKKTSLDKMS